MSVAPRPEITPEPRYEERLILFLDFLGFKELVDRSTHEPGFLRQLVAAMDVIAGIGADLGDIFRSQQVTQFSDSVVVSYAVTERSAVFQLLNEIAIAVVRLAERGFLVRGAVTVGSLYHTQHRLVGPAMNAAYGLESKVAVNPRVLIDEKVLQVARRARSRQHSAREEEAYARHFMTRDADGRFYFDYVSWNSVVDVTGGDNDGYDRYLGALGRLIRDGLRHDEPAVQAKFLWLHRQYAASLKLFRKMAENHPYRLENPELCEAIGRLPRLAIDARLARAAVKTARKKAERVAAKGVTSKKNRKKA